MTANHRSKPFIAYLLHFVQYSENTQGRLSLDLDSITVQPRTNRVVCKNISRGRCGVLQISQGNFSGAHSTDLRQRALFIAVVVPIRQSVVDLLFSEQFDPTKNLRPRGGPSGETFGEVLSATPKGPCDFFGEQHQNWSGWGNCRDSEVSRNDHCVDVIS